MFENFCYNPNLGEVTDCTLICASGNKALLNRHLAPSDTKEQREEIGVETEEEDMEVWLGALIQEVLPAITMHQLQDDTAKDPELRVLLQEKRAGTMSKTVE